VGLDVPARRSRMWGGVGLVATVICMASAGAAQAACPVSPTLQPFAQFGDDAPYELLSQGSFETGSDEWQLDDAYVATGNESYSVGSADDESSLRLSARGVALSPSLCVDASYPTWRLFATKVDGSRGQVKVDMLYTDASGRTRAASAGKLSNRHGEYSTWRPTPVLALGRGLPLSQSPTGMLSIRLRFTADRAGSWALDDIYLDPYRS